MFDSVELMIYLATLALMLTTAKTILRRIARNRGVHVHDGGYPSSAAGQGVFEHAGIRAHDDAG